MQTCAGTTGDDDEKLVTRIALAKNHRATGMGGTSDIVCERCDFPIEQARANIGVGERELSGDRLPGRSAEYIVLCPFDGPIDVLEQILAANDVGDPGRSQSPRKLRH